VCVCVLKKKSLLFACSKYKIDGELRQWSNLEYAQQ
jgi:hypothetical protein